MDSEPLSSRPECTQNGCQVEKTISPFFARTKKGAQAPAASDIASNATKEDAPPEKPSHVCAKYCDLH